VIILNQQKRNWY